MCRPQHGLRCVAAGPDERRQHIQHALQGLVCCVMWCSRRTCASSSSERSTVVQSSTSAHTAARPSLPALASCAAFKMCEW